MGLSGRQRKKLAIALIDAFPTLASLEQMLAYELDKNLRAIAGEGSLQDIVFKLIQTANSEGWVEDLVRGACESNSGNTTLCDVAQELLLNDQIKLKETEDRNKEIVPLSTTSNRPVVDLKTKILIEAEKVAPKYLYEVPEIEGFSKEKVVDEIYEMKKDGYLEALPLHSQASLYPGDFQYIKITRKGQEFLHNEPEKLVQAQKILVLAAIPDKLRLDKEIRSIEEAIKRAVKRDLFEIKIRTAVRPQDIRRALAEEQPSIVHFCGHGIEDGSLVLEDDSENHKAVSPFALAALFKLHANHVKCVLLNAYYSSKSAVTISQHIDYTIGMNQPIGDRGAIIFATGFYDGLGYENPDSLDVIHRAFEEGLVAIQMEDVSLLQIPVLKRKLEWIENSPSTHTNIYIERPPVEDLCYKAIVQPGELMRIKAPQRMGKTLLSEKLLDYARDLGYKVAKLDLKLADLNILADLTTFLQWLCVDVADTLEVHPQLDKYWQDIYGINKNCTRYFQKYILSLSENPLVLAIDNFERLFEYPEIFPQFCLLLRGWYETAKSGDRIGNLWKKLRLVIVHSTEAYPTLDINHSPFNVGKLIELPEFNLQQVIALAKKYELNGQLAEQGYVELIGLVGGHPYLLQQAIAHLKSQQVSLEEFLAIAPTEQGIYSNHLKEQLWKLQHNQALEIGYKQVVTANASVRLETEVAFKLHSLGLVQLHGNDCIPSCTLYRQYFSVRLG